MYQSSLTLAPLRISFFGGGTDFKSYYSKNDGIVVSAAINKHVYVHIKRHDPSFQEKYRISYSSVERCNNLSQIKNSIVRACLMLLNMDESLQISISSDLPSNSGLGSSSSFTVALLLGLHSLRGEQVSQSQLANEACEVEINILKSPIGKQDQYAAAFGGINSFEFLQGERVRIEPINLIESGMDSILKESLLIWTGKSRDANIILEDQENRFIINTNTLHKMHELAMKFKEELLTGNIQADRFGDLLNQSWELKKQLSPLINDSAIENVINKIMNLNCLGFKALGAGGGGFVFSIFEKIDFKLLNTIQEMNYFIPTLDFQGARIASLT